MKNLISAVTLLGVIGYANSSFSMPVSEILITNNTSIGLNTSIAGIPGYGIDASVSKPVGYDKVATGCFFGGNMDNCPINFANKNTGETVATVYINANTATLTQPPIFHGNYGSLYEVTGWESSPITQITIQEKA